MVDIKDKFTIGSKCVVAQDSDLRGDITLGNGCVLHPRSTILAMSGPIIIGSNCIVEENAVILNRSKDPMTIGDYNLFQVGCRIESPSIGSHNTFGPKSRVSYTISVSSHCSIGPGCVVLPSPFPPSLPPDREGNDKVEFMEKDVLEDRTAVFGEENRRRKIAVSGGAGGGGGGGGAGEEGAEGEGQTKALLVKHLDYLREALPKFNKLKMF